MNIQDLLNQYIPASLQARFLEEEASLLGSLGSELLEHEVGAVAKAALSFLGIPEANTPHVTNVAPENLPPAEPVFAQAVRVDPNAPPAPFDPAIHRIDPNAPTIDLVATQVQDTHDGSVA